MKEGTRILAWARRVLRPEDVERVIEPAVADLQHEVTTAPEHARGAVRRRGRRAVLAAMAQVMLAERLALARATPWWLLAFPLLAVVTGLACAVTGPAQLAFLGFGALAFALVATTPSRRITGAWSWLGVALLGLTLALGESHAGATRWLELGPLHVQMTLLALPLVAIGGPRPAAVAACLLAAAPDALSGLALGLALPHPVTLLGALVAVLREPAMVDGGLGVAELGALATLAALAATLLVPIAAWHLRALPEGRLLLALLPLGAAAHLAGHAPMPLVGAGGSAIVAVCLAFGLAARRAPRQTPRSATTAI